jgi:hypothetical protein
MRMAEWIIGLTLLGLAPLALAQSQGGGPSTELSIGENTKLSAGGLITLGYTGSYADASPSSHGLTWGLDGKLTGYYYNPKFISFTASPYYNESRANSSYQSLTGASGVDGSANFFAGSHFPGSVSYHYDRNSTGTFGLTGQPNFTTLGKGQGFGVNWSALLPKLPTLSVGYSQGEGSGTIYGTDQQTNSSTKLFNVRSGYDIAGFRLNAFFNRQSTNSEFPEFLSGLQNSVEDSSGHDVGFGAQHSLPLSGSLFVNYDRASYSNDSFSDSGQPSYASTYTDDIESAGVTFHPTQKLSLSATQNYTSNLSGFLAQSLNSGGLPVEGVNLGSGAYSVTTGGGATYQFTNYLAGSAQATHYTQSYFGKTYTGTYLVGTVNYGKRILDMFTFSGSVIDSSNGQGTNALGFVGNANFFHRIKRWQVSGVFSYAQNVQTLLVTYTTSYYNYGMNVHRRMPLGITWTAAFNGTHSGLTNQAGNTSRSEGYSSSLSTRRYNLTANYTRSTGISLLGVTGLVPVSGTPGVADFVNFGGSSYGGGFALTPVRQLVIAGSYNRAISDTMGETTSHNNTQIYNAQVQYHLRKVGFQAGYTRFTQGISAVGLPANSTMYFVGISRWVDFF